MSGLTNDYLQKLTSKLVPNFEGVFSADELHTIKNKKKKSVSIIFNTGKLGTPGIHFISIYITKNITYYFDSFGKRNIQSDIAKFITKLNRKCVMLCKPIQHITSNFCGLYALAFLLWKNKRKPISSFYKIFSKTNLKLNDKIVSKFILNEIK